jgi:hypothetical protein
VPADVEAGAYLTLCAACNAVVQLTDAQVVVNWASDSATLPQAVHWR